MRIATTTTVLVAALGVLAARPIAARAQANPGDDADEASGGPSRRTVRATVALTAAELARVAEGLTVTSAETREHTITRLTTLGEGAIPAMVQRMRDPAGPDAAATWRALKLFKERAPRGSRGELLGGVRVALERTRNAETVRVAETVLYLRALESIGTLEAARVIVDLGAAAGGQWRAEIARIARRMGERVVAAFILCRRHPLREMQRWARHTLWQIGLNKPGDVVQTRDNTVLADIIRAYGEIVDPKAMRVIASFIASERVQVREAARWALRRYGQSSLWIVRESMEALTGNETPASWSWEQAITELYAAHDRARFGPSYRLLDQGLAALSANDLRTVRARFDEVLARAPLLDRRGEMVPGYLTLGRARLEADDLVGAERDFRLALRLEPEGSRAAEVRAWIAFVRAERSLASGVADLALYREALQHQPGHRPAQAALVRLSRDERDDERRRQRWLAAGGVLGAALLGLLVMAVWRRRAPRAPLASRPAQQT
ncbi:MAG: hypothetical protein IT379_32375 [Deltaproteobacteria bacterium]|nr:hypothetical protein [Deltaproteobacteria bacterium]